MQSAAQQQNENMYGAAATERGRRRRRAETLALTFAAQFEELQPDAAQAAPRRFRGIAYSGGAIADHFFLGDVAIDIGSLRNADGDELPVLAQHERTLDAIAGRGVIRRVRTDDGLALEIEGELTGSTPAGKQVALLLAEGFPLQLSVGLTGRLREVDPRKPTRVNGRDLAIAGLFEDAVVREVSFVPVGADPRTYADVTFGRMETLMPAQAQNQHTEEEALHARIAELQAEVERLRAQRRTEQLAALMRDVGRPMPAGEALTCYMGMSDHAFETFAAELRAVAERQKRAVAADPTLFRSISTEVASGAGIEPDTAKRRAAALAAAVQKLTRT